ncbi:hypothetical protein Pmani_020599 [Petrolisthes manimaculis]|uniref:Secreted protein n=1 Tax=Petrolisthes manimaculis TaxID=1843537 RepID=A0AAE1PIC9_9EUCA|nr:hypothetical protein Pmani_020599 [Petrolisthes manimaculis]
MTSLTNKLTSLACLFLLSVRLTPPEQLHRNRHRRHKQRKSSRSHGSGSRRHSLGEAMAAVIFRQVAARLTGHAE